MNDFLNSMKQFYNSLSDAFLLVAIILIIVFVSLMVNMTQGVAAHQAEMQTLTVTLDKETRKTQKKQKEREKAEKRLAKALDEREKKKKKMESIKMLVTSKFADSKPEVQLLKVLKAAGLGGHDLDLLIKEIHDMPGDSLHLVVDVSSSMQSHFKYFESLLYAIVRLSGKDLSAITWYTDGHAGTFKGRIDDIVTRLMTQIPWSGSDEKARVGLLHAAGINLSTASFILIGDEPSTDGSVTKAEMDGAPVFTLPIVPYGSKLDPEEDALLVSFKKIADYTGGKMMVLEFKSGGR